MNFSEIAELMLIIAGFGSFALGCWSIRKNEWSAASAYTLMAILMALLRQSL